MDIKETLHEAVSDFQSGDFDSAQDKFQQVIKENPEEPNAHNLLGVVLGAKGQFEEAIDSISKAIKYKPDIASFYYNLSQIYKRSYQIDEALDSCSKALEQDGSYFPAIKDSVILLRHKGEFKEAHKFAMRAVKSYPEEPQVHNVLGEVYENTGNFEEAEKCYRRAIELNPDYYHPYTNLGTIKHNQEKLEEARELLEKSLQLNPHQPIVEHTLASVKGETPEKPHQDFVVSLFNRYADNFDDHMLALGYKVPEAIFRAVLELLGKKAQNLKIIDLGCGTGKSGRLFKNYSSLLIGVDLAPKMLESADRQQVYDELILGDVVDALASRDTKYDLIISADTFIYVGALESVFKQAGEALEDGGLLAFSIEEEEGEGYSLATTSRYKHARKYIENLAEKNGLSTSHDEEIGIRMQFDKMIPGRVMVLRKN